MIQSALLAVFLVSSSAAWGQECHTQCVYVPLEEGCQLMLEGSGEPWPVDRTLRVAASCLGDCWHPSQGQQPGAPPCWVPAEFFAPSALQITWVGAEGAGRPAPRVGEQVPVAAALESTCDLTAVFLLEGELEGARFELLGGGLQPGAELRLALALALLRVAVLARRQVGQQLCQLRPLAELGLGVRDQRR